MFKCEKLNNKFLDYGLTFFKTGIFFLASAPIIACLFLIFSLLISFFFNKNIFKNKFDYPFLICIPLMIIGSLLNYQNISNSNFLSELSNPYLPIIGLANWIPLFLCFSGFEVYLNSNQKKRDCIVLFIAGTIPLIFSGFGQYFFNWYGPFSLLNGLIIWYQRPLGEGFTAMTGFFNNSNYAGIWLVMVIPFCLGLLQEKFQKKYHKLIIFFILLFLCVSVTITNSRSAWAGMIIAMILMFINKKKLFLIPFFPIVTLAILRITNFLVDSKGYSFLREVIPSRVLLDFDGIERIDGGFSRIDIWQYAISLIKERPLWGWGSGTFPQLIENSTTYWRGHPHNLILELAFSFGLIITLIIVIAIIFILLRSLKIIFFKEEGVQNSVNKSWLVSILIILFAQMVDLQYFDIRISMAIWILLSGLKTFNPVF